MRVTNESITSRYFQAFEELKTMGKIESIQGFCREFGIDKRNFYQQRADVSRNIIKADWLAYLVSEYGVNARWLLTGFGSMLT